MKASEYLNNMRPKMLKFALESRQTLLLVGAVERVTGRPCPRGRELGQTIRRGVLVSIAECKRQEARLAAVIAIGGDWEMSDV